MYERVLKGFLIAASLISLTVAVLVAVSAYTSRDREIVPEALAEPETVVASSTPTLSATPTPTPPPKPESASLDASQGVYGGLGSWVDVYDARAWRNPTAAVRDMARHGVRTLYLQTAHHNSKTAIFMPKATREFIAQAHAHSIRVVAWYLPSMESGSSDLARVRRAIDFKTADGQHFDSFALDIESTDVHSISVRNRNLKTLSKKIRAYVGPDYELGAIIPAPAGLERKHEYWDPFPYEMLTEYYDVFLPMGYYSFHANSASGAYADACANVRIIRSKPGCEHVPIHLIGGIAEDSNAREVRAFVKAVRTYELLGASLYGWTGTSGDQWKALSAVEN